MKVTAREAKLLTARFAKLQVEMCKGYSPGPKYQEILELRRRLARALKACREVYRVPMDDIQASEYTNSIASAMAATHAVYGNESEELRAKRNSASEQSKETKGKSG